MATYEVTDQKTGRKVRLTGDSPPTDAELEQIFSRLPESAAPTPSPEVPYSDPLPEGAPPRNETVTTGPPSLMQRAGRYVSDYASGIRNAVSGLDPMTAGVGGAEAALTLATGAVSPVSSLMSAFTGSREVPPEEFVYQPRTGSGRAIVNTIGAVAKPLSDSGADMALAPVAAEMAAVGPRVPKSPTATQANAARIIAEGEKHGVPVFFDDVTKNAVAKKAGVVAENLGSLGTGAGRARQAEAAKEAATNLANRTKSRVAIERSLARQAAAETGGTISKVATSDDVPVLIQSGLKAQLAQFRKTSKDLYERADKPLDTRGIVPTPKFDDALDAARVELMSRGSLADKNVMGLLDKYESGPKGIFSFVRKQVRSQLGDDIGNFYSGDKAAIGQKGIETLQSMKSALDEDLAAFARKASGDGYENWKRADAHYQANIVPFKEAGFRDLAKTAEPEKVWSYLMAQGSLKSRAVRMYRSLNDQGRANVRYGLVKDALDKSMIEKGSTTTFSPAKFAKYLEDHENAINTFFQGRDLQEIKGFQSLMRSVERAGQYAENPPTGNRLVMPLAVGGAAFNPTATGVIVGSGLATRVLFQTATGRNLLLGLSKAKAGSKAEAALTRRALSLVAAGTAARVSGQQGSSPEELPATAEIATR